MYRDNKDKAIDKEPESPLLKSINTLCAMTKYNLSSENQIKQAFLLGLWHESFPEYMLGDVEAAHWWDYSKNLGEPGSGSGASMFDSPYANLQRFQFISDTVDSWHQCYKDLRVMGWQRLKVHREGGRLQYLLHQHRLSMPEGYRDVHLILDISLSTCKQVQVGTKMVEQPIFETKCEDFVELPEGLIKQLGDGETITDYRIPADPPPPNAEVTQLIVIDDVEGVEMPEGQIPSKADWERDIEAPLDVRTGVYSSNKDDEIPF